MLRFYRHIITLEIREMLTSFWAQSPKKHLWEQYDPPIIPPPEQGPSIEEQIAELFQRVTALENA